MGGRFHVSEVKLRDLVERLPFYAIARLYKCDARQVGALARHYGLVSRFMAKAGTAEEGERIRALAADGWSTKRICAEIGRSQEFVRSRLRPPADEGDDADFPEDTEGWPERTITAEAALGECRFEDVSEAVLCREWPPWRLPLNGAALASAAQAAHRTPSRSTADLCIDA